MIRSAESSSCGISAIFLTEFVVALGKYSFFTAGRHCLLYATAVFAMALSARLSVTFRYFVQTNEATIMRFSLSGSEIILVSGEV